MDFPGLDEITYPMVGLFIDVLGAFLLLRSGLTLRNDDIRGEASFSVQCTTEDDNYQPEVAVGLVLLRFDTKWGAAYLIVGFILQMISSVIKLPHNNMAARIPVGALFTLALYEFWRRRLKLAGVNHILDRKPKA